MEYRPAGLAAGTRGSVRQNMMTARLTAGGARPRNLFVRFHGMRNHADTSVAAVSSGSPQAVETALGGIVPAGERISVELYRRDSAGDTLVTTVDWPHPFNVTAAVRTVGGVRYGITLELVRR